MASVVDVVARPSLGTITVPCPQDREAMEGMLVEHGAVTYDATRKVFKIDLDKITENDLAKRTMTVWGCFRASSGQIMGCCDLNFSKEYAERYASLPAIRNQTLEASFADRSLLQQLRRDLSLKYQDIFKKYVEAHLTARQGVDKEAAKLLPIQASPAHAKLYKESRLPKDVTIVCSSLEVTGVDELDHKDNGDDAGLDTDTSSAGPLQTEIQAHGSVLGTESQVFLAELTSGFQEAHTKRITIPEDASTVRKLVKFMYDYQPPEIGTDKEAYKLYNLARVYQVEKLMEYCDAGAKRYDLTFSHPSTLTSPQAIFELFSDPTRVLDEDLVETYIEAVAKVKRTYRDHLQKYLVPTTES